MFGAFGEECVGDAVEGHIEGLEGYQCDVCGAYVDSLTEYPDFLSELTVEKVPEYTEEKLKSIRGIPVNRIIIGSESKGRVEVSIPIFVSFEDQKKIIRQQLSLLEYTKNLILEKNLDIMPKR